MFTSITIIPTQVYSLTPSYLAYILRCILRYAPEGSNIVNLRKVDSSLTITLPASAVDAMHLRENDEIAIEVVGNRIVLAHATPDFQEGWAAYQSIEPHYQNANRKLTE